MKFKLPALSYRRGFVRLYAVFTVGWIVALLVALPSYRLKVWVPEKGAFVAPRPDEWRGPAPGIISRLSSIPFRPTPVGETESEHRAHLKAGWDTTTDNLAPPATPSADFTAIAKEFGGIPIRQVCGDNSPVMPAPVWETVPKETESEHRKRLSAEILSDPNFHALPIEERRKVMLTVDPQDFGSLPPAEQDIIISAHKLTPLPLDCWERATSFDVEAARKSGYSDNEILSYLTSTRYLGESRYAPVKPAPAPDELRFAASRIGKSLWLLGLLFGPPVVGYLGLFGIIPWVYRGFKATAQI